MQIFRNEKIIEYKISHNQLTIRFFDRKVSIQSQNFDEEESNIFFTVDFHDFSLRITNFDWEKKLVIDWENKLEVSWENLTKHDMLYVVYEQCSSSGGFILQSVIIKIWIIFSCINIYKTEFYRELIRVERKNMIGKTFNIFVFEKSL